MTKISIIAAALLALSCGPNEGVLRSGKESPEPYNAAPARPPVDKEVDAMRTAGFTFIYALKRKDGAKLDDDDRGFIKVQTVEANRRVATDDGLVVVVGTNTPIPVGKMKFLAARFALENYSQAPIETPNGSPNSVK